MKQKPAIASPKESLGHHGIAIAKIFITMMEKRPQYLRRYFLNLMGAYIC